MDATIQIIILFIVILTLIQIALYSYKKFILSKKEVEDDFAKLDDMAKEKEEANNRKDYGRFHGVLKRESIIDFLGFDTVRDGMIIRNNGTEYVMVLECSGVNFDLRSENEKLGIEEGFLQFLNALRFPVQLYVQTRRVNFEDVLDNYHQRIKDFGNDIEKAEEEIVKAEKLGDRKRAEMLRYEKSRRENLYDYAVDSIQYTEQLSQKKNVLQQKTYVVVSYLIDELGQKVNDYTQEEKEQHVFTELVTRCNNLSSALQASRVSSKLLNSEELIELLFNAFNRDEMENINLKTFFNTDYEEILYTKSEDYIEKQKKLIKKDISKAALDLATSSIIRADRERKKEILNMKLKKPDQIKQKASKLIDDKKDVLIPETYEKAKKIVENANIEQDKDVKKELEKNPELQKQLEDSREVEKQKLEDERLKNDKNNNGIRDDLEISEEEKHKLQSETFMEQEFSQELKDIEDN